MIWIYIAGPYRGKTREDVRINIGFARIAAEQFWRHRVAAFCPHLNTGYMDDLCPDGIFLEAGLDMVRRCDGIYMLPKWRESQGALSERAWAVYWGKPIFEDFDLAVGWATAERNET